MLAKGCIRPSSNPYGASLPFFHINAGEFYMYIDYCMFNKYNRVVKYPITHIDDIFDKFLTATIFNNIDLTNAYYLILFENGNQFKIAIKLVSDCING